jgi:hypothetical protein
VVIRDSCFVIRHSLVIRASSFDIRNSFWVDCGNAADLAALASGTHRASSPLMLDERFLLTLAGNQPILFVPNAALLSRIWPHGVLHNLAQAPGLESRHLCR